MSPYTDDHLNKLYDMLFCDDVEPYLSADVTIDVYPWTDLFRPSPSIEDLRAIIADPLLETRPQALASCLIRKSGFNDAGKHLFGVIIEVNMKEGLDVLSVYEDGTARYINYSGKLIVWDTDTEESNKLTADLFTAARRVVEQIGPSEAPRLPPPISGNARLSFIVSDGSYFGEGPFEALAQDPLGGAVIHRGSEFMKFLVRTVMGQSL